MEKEEYIMRYGKEAYETILEGNRDRAEIWRGNNPKKVKAQSQEQSRKGGKYYLQIRKYFSTGIPHERVLVRQKHLRYYTPYKKLIAPESQIHHEWIPDTANYRGVALVEADQHMHRFIDVIQILEGEITLFTEASLQD